MSTKLIELILAIKALPTKNKGIQNAVNAEVKRLTEHLAKETNK